MTDDEQQLLCRIAIARAMAGVVPSARYGVAQLDTFAAATAKQKKALEVARKFCSLMPWLDSESPSGLWLIGPPGTGKTHLAVGALRFAVALDVEDGEKPAHRFISHVEFIREWQKARARRGGDDALFSQYSEEGQILVLDDVRAPRASDDADALDWLVELRYRQRCCPTILTTNLNLSDLRAALGDRSFDRLREGALMAVLDGASHRARFAWNGPPDPDEVGE